jgi:hypothetical protein
MSERRKPAKLNRIFNPNSRPQASASPTPGGACEHYVFISKGTDL